MPENSLQPNPLATARPNFPEGAEVTWTRDESPWVESLKQTFGDGPFTVTHTKRATYGTPQVRLTKPDGNELIHSDNQIWFYKSWLEIN